ncbi:hypothetical protein [Vallicoccus soli]|uniref:DUF2029 domain-containing protein n=1 Tax=Vallicoccus soli TaxID=2339232 RepID=A0A3A3YR40_9ACTN|nr:hypothetical protein [Vallicoccus soli]RJK93175.1 hypothetical protein D5H78_17380 [Vallicoccus soli]
MDRAVRGALRVVAPLALGALVAVLLWLRLRRDVRPTLWAEDGRIFLTRALLDGTDAVLQPYQGSLHLAPRFVALAVERLPVEKFALGMNAGACVLAGLAAAVVLAASSTLVESRPLRLGLALLPVLLPVLGVEVLASAANLHWLALWAAAWVLLHRPSGPVAAVGWAVVALLCALTEILVVLLAPLVVLVVLRAERGRAPGHALWPAAALLVGAAVQLGVTLAQPRSRLDVPRPSTVEVAELFGLQVLLPLWTFDPDRLVGLAERAPLSLVLAGLPVLGCLALLALPGPAARERRAPALLLVAVGVAVFWLATLWNWTPDKEDPREVVEQVAFHTRYAVPAGLLVLSGAVLGLDAGLAPREGPPRRWPRVVATGLAGVLAAGMLLALPSVPTRRLAEPDWLDLVAAGREQCERPRQRTVQLWPLSPGGTWSVRVPCARLRG